MKKIYFFLLIVNLFSIQAVFSQGADCANSDAFCAGGAGLTFQNSTGTTTQQDVDYECLGSQPNPAWFYMQISIAGNISFQISQATNGGNPIDVDYIVWGPFASPSCGPTNLNPTTSVSCSFSAAAVENFTLPNAQVGEIYVVLLTNYSGQAGNITVTQTNVGQTGAGATDCNIVCPLSLDDQVICVGGQAILTATIAGATTYQWSGPSGPIPGNVQSITVNQSGTYTVIVNKPGCVANATASATVSYYAPPAINAPANLLQCANIPNFNLNDAIANIFNGTGLNPGDFELSFHTSAINAQNVANPIGNPGSYPGPAGGAGSCTTIYLSVTDNGPSSSGCVSVFPFTICFDTCTATPVQPGNLTLCESSLGSGTAVFNFLPQTPIVLGTNAAADYTVTYHLTQNNADNDTGAVGPTNVTGTNGQTIYVRMEENANPLTYGTTTFQLIVNPLPTATISGTTTICSGTNTVITFTGTPNAVVTYHVDANPNTTINLGATGTNTVTTPNLTASSTYTLVSVLNPATSCSRNITGSAVVTVLPLPTATISGTTTVCRNAASPLITLTGANGTAPYTFTYAINNVVQPTVTTVVPSSSITLSAPTTTPGTYVYTLVSVQSGATPACSQNQTGSATITVNPLPSATITGSVATCLNFTEPQLVITGANGTQPYTFTYSINNVIQPTVQTSGGNSVIINVPTDTAGTFTYDLISVTDGSATPCSEPQTGSAVVTVSTPPVISTPTNYVVCDDSQNNDGLYCNFDLDTKINEISGGDPNIVVTFHETLTNSQTGANPLVSPYCNIDPDSQTIYVRAYTVGSPACYTNTTFLLTINPLPLANPVIADYELCDYNNPGDGVEVFTLNSMDVEIANGQTGVIISYYLTQGDAQALTNPLPNSYTNGVTPEQVIWINILNNATGCNTVSSFNIVVNPVPPATTPEPIFQCSNGNTNQAQFDLTINEGVVTNGNISGLTITYYNTLLDAQNETSPILTPLDYTGTDNEIVYIRVEDNATGCYATTTQLLRVTQGPLAVTPLPLHYCDPNNDGFGFFDLESTAIEIQGGTAISSVSVSFYETETDALIGAAPSLTSPYENINPWTQTIYVRVFYTLTGCANYVQLQLIVDPTPEATEPDDYELCDYTGQVGYETFDLTTTIPQVLGSIDPTQVNVTFHPTFVDAQGDTNAIGGVTNYINQTQWNQTLYVRVEFIATGCYDVVELDLIVNPLPNATQPNYPQYTLCDYNAPIGYEVFDLASQVDPILLGQQGMTVTFYPSLAMAQAQAPGTSINQTNPDLQYQNTSIYVQTLGVVITNSETLCYSISTMDIRVVPLPTPIPPTGPYTICDDNQDGFSCEFDLVTLETDILQGANYILTFHETLTDAQSGNTPIDTTVPYCNINPFTQTLYVRAQDPLTGCWSVIPVVLNVNESPIAPVNLDDIEVCDDDNNPQNAITGIDLTQRTPDVLAQQPASGSYTVTYYTTQLGAEQGTAPIIPATNYIGSNGQTIWVRVEDDVTGCYNIGSFQLIINIPLLLTTPTPLSVCDDDANPNDQYHTFDLTVRDVMITQGLSGYTVTYYPTYTDAQNGTNAITNPSAYTNIVPAVQTLGVVVRSAAGCESITTLDIRVLPIPTPNTNPAPLAPQCDDNNPGDMMEVFDLTVNAGYITNGDPNLTLHYYHTQADALVPQNEIMNPTAASVGGNVWIRVENNRVDYQGNHCYVLVEQPLTVNPLPSITPIADYQICEADPSGVNDGFEVFDLTSQSAALLAGNPTPPSYTVVFYQDAGMTIQIANPTAYTNLSNPQTIYVQATNDLTGCQSVVGQFNILVNPKPSINFVMADMSECDYDGVNDGMMLYTQNPTSTQTSLAGYVDDILGPAQTAPTYIVEFYYNNQADAEAGNTANALTGLDTYQVQTGTYWVRVENTVTGCYVLDSFDVIIEELAEPVITSNTGSNIACVRWNTTTVTNNLILDSGITAPDYTFNWYADGVLIPGADSSTYEVLDIAANSVTYTVEAVSVNPPLLGCTSDITPASTFVVVRSGPAANITYTVTNAFAENQVITVTNEGYGVYEYSLDDGPRQTSNVFENVPLGPHTIYVWDVRDPNGYSCGVEVMEGVQVIDYPHYFTPNGDGIHESWNVTGLDGPNYAGQTKIYIFDRYGKLLKQISPTSEGWDGTFNGHPLPSTDYWFTVDYPEAGAMKQFRAHFSLKR